MVVLKRRTGAACGVGVGEGVGVGGWYEESILQPKGGGGRGVFAQEVTGCRGKGSDGTD